MSLVEYQPHQIVFLECKEKRLYAEVIQTVIDRRLCWARPLVMVDQSLSNTKQFSRWDSQQTIETALEGLLDLRQAPDLLLPLSWFQVAVDVEVIPVLAQLSGLKPETHSASAEVEVQYQSSPQAQLQQFIQVLCQTNREQASHDRIESGDR
jgi:hypothetical protein